MVFEIVFVIESYHPSGGRLPFEAEAPVAEEVALDVGLFAGAGVGASLGGYERLGEGLEVGGVSLPDTPSLAVGNPGLAAELCVHREAELALKGEFGGVSAAEVYGARAVESAERIVGVSGAPAVEPPVVVEDTVGDVALDGEHPLATPHVGIVEDADAHLRDWACVPALGQGSRRERLVEEAVGDFLGADHGVEAAVLHLGIELLGDESRLEPVGDAHIDAGAP